MNRKDCQKIKPKPPFAVFLDCFSPALWNKIYVFSNIFLNLCLHGNDSFDIPFKHLKRKLITFAWNWIPFLLLYFSNLFCSLRYSMHLSKSQIFNEVIFYLGLLPQDTLTWTTQEFFLETFFYMVPSNVETSFQPPSMVFILVQLFHRLTLPWYSNMN